MASIHLPCGCHINDAFVIGMCMQHYSEYREKVTEEEEAYREFINRIECPASSAGAKSDG